MTHRAVDESGTIDVPGARLYYEVAGSGPAVVLIHAGVANLRMWDAQVEALAPRYRVIRYDTRGFGRTANEDVEFSNRDDLRAVLEHVGVPRATVLGISRGGHIAIDFTLDSPDRVEALIACAPGLGGFEFDDPSLASTWDEMEALWQAHDWDQLVEREVRLWADGPGQPERVSTDVRRLMTEMGHENYAVDRPEGKPIPLAPPAAERLAEISVPALLMVGDLDTAGVIAAADRLRAEVPGIRSITFPGVAHMINLERPAEFNAAVLAFLEEVHPATA